MSVFSKIVYVLAVIFALTAGLSSWAVFVVSPPVSFSEPKLVAIEPGTSLKEVAELLHEKKLISSPFWFRAFVIINEAEHSIQAGDYYIEHPTPAHILAERFSTGSFGLRPFRVTIFEGWTVFDIAEHLEFHFKNFDSELFLAEAEEGYMFPDTYFFSPNAQTHEFVERMRSNFEEKMDIVRDEIEESPYTEEEILIMASILETEANTRESKRKVADILWRRIEIDMPLQVDAAFSYVNGKNTYQLTLDDLQIDNPYNTYRYTGLPPGPIANPGMDSIEAALDPADTDYLYFLSDLSGNMYYASDFEGHQYNRAHFLRR